MKKIKAWWSGDGEWLCLLVNNDVTVSLNRDEATELLKAIVYGPIPDRLARAD
jgi:hypothetical protein